MIELYYWTTPNGHKITIFLEEAELPYKIIPINIRNGEQFDPKYLQISPNNKIPAIVDTKPNDTSKHLSIFESGAILLYLADKTGRFIPKDQKGRYETIEWLFWQVGGLGPMAGQSHHFSNFAPEPIPYAIERYIKETARLYGVLNKQLADREFIAGGYSIADIACYPWIVPHEKQGQNLDDFPNLKRWYHHMESRPAVQRAYLKAQEINDESTPMTEEAKRIMFGHGAGAGVVKEEKKK
jgi:GSH-dependent disulfide-bond oxidoreductase